MPKQSGFFKDIQFFEEEFNGIMPLEIMIDTKRKKGVMKLATIKRMNELEELIIETPELSKPLSVVGLVKYSKQAYYNGNPKYYQIPSSQENSFILSYAKKSTSDVDMLKNFVDSTGQYARITTFMKDVPIEKMKTIEDDLRKKIAKVFPEEKYNVTITGKAYLFPKRNVLFGKKLSHFIVLSYSLNLICLWLICLGHSG